MRGRARHHRRPGMSLRSKKGKIAAAGASLALAATIMGVGLAGPASAAWAAPSAPGIERLMQAPTSPPAPKPGQPGQPGQGQRGQNMEQRHQAYQNALAARLGVSADQLSAAMKQARIDVINQEV